MNESTSMENIDTADITQGATNTAILKSKLMAGEFKFSQKRKKSKVWSVFAMIEDANGQEIRNVVGCKRCLNIYKFGKSTSNLVRHKCYLFGTAEKNEIEADVDSEIKKKCTRIMTEWTISNCRPFNIADDAGFKKLSSFFLSVGATYGNKVNIESLLPHPTTISRNINKLYNFHFDEIKSEISKIRSNSYGLTADIWTDNCIRSSFMSVTIHYIFQGKIVHRLLAMKSMEDEVCSGTNIKKKMSNILKEFGCALEEDNPIIVIERGSNMVSAFRGNNNVHCINHLINTIVEKTVGSIPELAALTTQCSKLVKYFKKAGINSNMETTVKSMSPTRWIPVFYLLQSVERNRVDICNILKEKNELNRIQNINLNDLSSTTKLLEIFENSLKTLEGDNYPTLHLVIPHIHRLKKACLANQDDTDLIKQIKRCLSELLHTVIYKNLKIFHKVALFLFPPANNLMQFNETEKDEIIKMCQKIARSLSKTCSGTDENNQLKQCQKDDIFADFVQLSQQGSLDNLIVNEINTYRGINISLTDNFDVIQWWNMHENQFPHLYKVICKILATPASSASSERAFSAARLLITEKRCNILGNLDLVDKIMFLHTNINEINENILE